MEISLPSETSSPLITVAAAIRNVLLISVLIVKERGSPPSVGFLKEPGHLVISVIKCNFGCILQY